MRRIQNAEFGDSEVIVSVGCFKTSGADELMKYCHPEYVEAYDPEQSVFLSYCSVFAHRKGKFLPIAKAVSDKAGLAMLKGKSYNSTICPRSGVKLPNQYPVVVVAFDDVVRNVHAAFGRVDRVVMNCEGAEVPIIVHATTLLLCRYFFVQFHTFADTLSVGADEVESCLKKLSQTHDMRLAGKARSEYEGYLK